MRRATTLLTVLILLCALPAATAQVRHEVHFPDLPDYRTLKCDLHTHTVFSDGAVWPLVRIDAPTEALSAGLPYRATNFLTGPDQPLSVKLVLPER